MINGTHANILIVDDEETDRRAVKRALVKNKITNRTIEAENGEIALQCLQNEVTAQSILPYIILLDLNMPVMDGHEFLEKVRSDQKLKQAVIFVLTTSSDPRDKNRAYDKNIAGYMRKSEITEDFLQKIQLLEKYLDNVELPES